MRTTRPFRIAAASCVIGLLAVSCGSSDDAAPAETVESTVGSTDGAEADSSPGTDAATDEAVPASLQFSAPLVGGGEIDGSTLAGKPTAFWFWAPT